MSTRRPEPFPDCPALDGCQCQGRSTCIDVGGTGGGIFRFMYSRFRQEASEICKNPALAEIAKKIQLSGDLFTKVKLHFKDYKTLYELKIQINMADEQLNAIADPETQAYEDLKTILPLN